MAVTSIRSISLLGLNGTLVDIEVDISDGLPIYTLLGLPDTALIESKDRIVLGLENKIDLSRNMPPQKIDMIEVKLEEEEFSEFKPVAKR
jgi:magnesium chelatase family protein